MSDFEHADISRRLALAIGWREDQLFNEHDGSYTSINLSHHQFIQTWKDFDYRDPLVIWPIAERFNAFPRSSTASCGQLWFARVRGPSHMPMLEFSKADTAAKAVALAVIKRREQT